MSSKAVSASEDSPRRPLQEPEPRPRFDCKLEIIPFKHCTRPIDELKKRCTGTSECGGFLHSAAKFGVDPGVWILFRLIGDIDPEHPALRVTLSAWFLPPQGCSYIPVEVPGLKEVEVPANVVGGAGGPDSFPSLRKTKYRCPSDEKYVASLDPMDLLPRKWEWNSLGKALRERTLDGEDPFTFCNLFHQRVMIRLKLYCGRNPVDEDETTIEIYDHSRFGSLYGRVMTQVVRVDAGQQGIEAGYHPWFPVLIIGTAKALNYLKLVERDFKSQKKNFGDPCWLMRVGIYLELLTVLGTIEALKETPPFEDLLSKEERQCFEKDCAFSKIRSAVDVEAWRRVWKGHKHVPYMGRRGYPVHIGGNFKAKGWAIKEFLKAHHSDLRVAIRLAGANKECSQRTWQKVFRAAEKAVVDKVEEAFPEMQFMSERTKAFTLWHKEGVISLGEDGIFPSATRQYRKSMNEVASDAKKFGLMDFDGAECVPVNESILEAIMAENKKLEKNLVSRDDAQDSCR